MSIEAMKQALEALEEINELSIGENAICLPAEIDTAMDALRTAIKQAQKQEPFGYFRYDLRLDAWVQNRAGITGTPFYTSPPPRQPLTDEQIFEISNGFALFMFPVETRVTDRELAFARAIEEAVNKQPRSIPLTDDEMWKLWNAQGDDFMEQQAAIAFARAIEAAHSIKGEA